MSWVRFVCRRNDRDTTCYLTTRLWPFSSAKATEAKQLDVCCNRDVRDMNIKGIFVFHDPHDWGRDIQIMLDIILPSLELSRNDWEQNPPIDVVFCNPDLLWKSEHAYPRLGQGSFICAFQGV